MWCSVAEVEIAVVGRTRLEHVAEDDIVELVARQRSHSTSG